MKAAFSLRVVCLTAALFGASLSSGQQTASPGADWSMGSMPGMEGQGGGMAMHSMESRHMDMGPHMKMTALRPVQPGDEARANTIVEAARKVAAQYEDYRTALKEGFHIFLPNVPQKQYHFTNSRYAIEAQFHFNPDHPTSLLYEKQGEGYKLVGLMYTAPRGATEDDLNRRIPLSIAQWHEHVNLCFPPKDKRWEVLMPHPEFGPAGSISTREACESAGGTFHPLIFGWMVHVYPFEKNPNGIWSVEKQMHGHSSAD